MNGQILTEDEIRAQGTAMVNCLHRQLSDAHARIAQLEGDKAILEYRLQEAITERRLAQASEAAT